MQISIAYLFAGIAIAIVAAVAISQISFEHEEAQPQAEKQGWLVLNAAKETNYGGKNAVWISLEGNLHGEGQAGEIETFIYREKPAGRVVLVDGEWVGAKNYREFECALKLEAKRLGLPFEKKPLAQLGGADEGRIIIMPSGAWPKSISNISQILGRSDVFIYIGVRENVSLLEGGALVEGGADERIVFGGEKKSFGLEEAYEQALGSAQAWTVPKTLGERQDAAKFAQEILGSALRSQENLLLARGEQDFEKKYSQIIGLKESAQEMWVRVIASFGGRIEKVWDAQVEKNDAKFEGPKEVARGRAAVFQAIIWPSYPQDEQITYMAAVYDGFGQKKYSENIGGGNMSGAAPGQKAAWVGSFSFSNWPEGSRHALLQIEDQYGRVYGRAAVDVAGYEIVPVWQKGFEKKFLITKDGEPAENREINVQKKGAKEWTSLEVYDGVVKVNSQWADGENTLLFDIDGAILQHSWDEGGGGQWKAIVDIGIVAVAALLVLHFALAGSKKRVYSIIVPETVKPAQREMRISRRRLLENLENPSNLQKLMDKMHADGGLDAKSAISIESLKSAAAQLRQEGLAREYGGYYVDARKMENEEFECRALEMILRDRLMSLGIGLHKIGGEYEDSNTKRWAIWDGKLLEKLCRKKQTMVEFALFPSKVREREFEKELAARGDVGACRIKLAKALGRLRFVQIENISDVVRGAAPKRAK